MRRTSLVLKAAVLLMCIYSVAAGVCGEYSCPEALSCCNDSRYGYLCYDPATHHCANDGTFLCPKTQDQVCGDQCFDSNEYRCSNGNLCGASEQSCNGQCYNTEEHDCVENQLCPKGSAVCNNQCYDPQQFQCFQPGTRGYLCPRGMGLCGTYCFDPSIQTCVDNAIVPIESNLQCRNDPYPPASCDKQCCYGECYDAFSNYCVGQQSSFPRTCPLGQDSCFTFGGNYRCFDPKTQICCGITPGPKLCTKGDCGCCPNQPGCTPDV